MATQYANGQIVTNGLVLALNAADQNSYPGSGTTWFNLNSNVYNATLANGPTFNNSNGGSIVFDGTDDYASSGNIGSATSFTVLIWFYPISVTNYQNPIDCNYSYNGNTGNIGPRLEMDSNGILGWVYSNITNDNNQFYFQRVTNGGLAANTWHCAGITYDGSGNSSVTYYNGIATANARGAIGSPSGFVGTMNNVNLGRGFHLGGGERYFAGRIANALIYNRSLTATEILQNYNAQKTRFGL